MIFLYKRDISVELAFYRIMYLMYGDSSLTFLTTNFWNSILLYVNWKILYEEIEASKKIRRFQGKF